MRTIEVLPYDTRWATAYQEIAAVFRDNLGNLALAVEHIGSTSVPGLAAKPILDVMVIIPDTDTAFKHIEIALNKIGYRHEGNLGIQGREAFKNRDRKWEYDRNGIEWQIHLYVCKNQAPVLVEFLAFRDYLRQHPEDALEYGRVKIDAAEKYRHDVDEYMAYKSTCVKNILEKVVIVKKSVTKYLESLEIPCIG